MRDSSKPVRSPIYIHFVTVYLVRNRYVEFADGKEEASLVTSKWYAQ